MGMTSGQINQTDSVSSGGQALWSDPTRLEQPGSTLALKELEDGRTRTAGADFGAQLASPGPKADLASPTSVGECTSQEPALAPSRDAVTGITEWTRDI